MCPNDDGGRPSKLVLTGDTSAVRPPGIRPAFRGDEAVPTLERSRSRNNFDGVRLLAAIFIVYGHQTVDQSGTFGLRLLMLFSISGFLNSKPFIGQYLFQHIADGFFIIYDQNIGHIIFI